MLEKWKVVGRYAGSTRFFSS